MSNTAHRHVGRVQNRFGDSRASSRIPQGALIYTMDGALPVEFISEGDRIITRAGMRVLRRISGNHMAGFEMGFDGPEVIYADGAEMSV